MSFAERIEAAAALAQELRRLDSERAGLEFAEDRGRATPAELARAEELRQLRRGPAAGLREAFAELSSSDREQWLDYRDQVGRGLRALAATAESERLSAAAALYHWEDWRHCEPPFQDACVTFAEGLHVLSSNQADINRILADTTQPSTAETLARRLSAELGGRFNAVALPLEPRDPFQLPLPAWLVIAGPAGARHVMALIHGFLVHLQGPEAAELRIEDLDARALKAARAQLQKAAAVWIDQAPQRLGFAEAAIILHGVLAAQLAQEQWIVGIDETRAGIWLVRQGRRLPVGLQLAQRRGDLTLTLSGQPRPIATPADLANADVLDDVRAQLAALH